MPWLQNIFNVHCCVIMIGLVNSNLAVGKWFSILPHNEPLLPIITANKKNMPAP